jgi:hypothetical protein
MRMATVLLGCLVSLSTVAQADALVWKTEAKLESMTEQPGCDPDKDENCHDTISYIGHSRFGINLYLTYVEAVRAQIGFGLQENVATMMLADQIHDGAFDWGGSSNGGAFKPVVVIKRFYVMNPDTAITDKTKTQLLIFKLKADGTSCLIPIEKSTSDNATARKLAEDNLASAACGN